ncbi:ABC transporter permease [Acrocarpospora catenulata]|uniref:ABC transporter permease n=1 Tax=Acrocarpospora catenulata TaxID=2836182 RepID=UPI001BDA8049|nr:ABC transporter permease [Acrocarpospora catenulata]
MNFWTLAGLPGIVFLGAVFGIPLVLIVIRSFTDPGPENYLEIFTNERYLGSILRTVGMSLTVTLVCLVLAYPYAYLMARSSTFVKLLLGAMLLTSYWTSSLVRTFAWGAILNNTGIINQFLQDLGVIDQPLPLIRNMFAVFVGMTHVLLPYAVLAIYATLRTIDVDLERAALGMGARPVKAFWRITFPLSLPGVAAGAILVFVIGLGFYLTPMYLGGPGQELVSEMVAREVQDFLRPGRAAALSVVLLVFVGLILVIATRFVGLGAIVGNAAIDGRKNAAK